MRRSTGNGSENNAWLLHTKRVAVKPHLPRDARLVPDSPPWQQLMHRIPWHLQRSRCEQAHKARGRIQAAYSYHPKPMSNLFLVLHENHGRPRRKCLWRLPRNAELLPSPDEAWPWDHVGWLPCPELGAHSCLMERPWQVCCIKSVIPHSTSPVYLGAVLAVVQITGEHRRSPIASSNMSPA